MIGRVQRIGVRAPIILMGGILITFTLEPHADSIDIFPHNAHHAVHGLRNLCIERDSLLWWGVVMFFLAVAARLLNIRANRMASKVARDTIDKKPFPIQIALDYFLLSPKKYFPRFGIHPLHNRQGF